MWHWWLRVSYTNQLILGIICGALGTIWLAPYLITEQPKQHSIFVYGTLQNNFARFYACRCFVSQTPAILPKYQKVGRNIIPNETAVVRGSIIQVSNATLERIDRYERIPTHYTREQIVINGETHWVYIKVQQETQLRIL
jgi:gamma-glutamylcyclotransferase (GGCT)/AIG2-like uncharacterized protein YtfP